MKREREREKTREKSPEGERQTDRRMFVVLSLFHYLVKSK
jgi:hypothetical protein